ncbi:V-type ATP synthase subunit D [Parabacteroides distasonis]|nr:V-type ATP synthase subunit D [Parabacteroides distasonis]MCS2855364.1 V-type ATP synthase subunit D [Parabacteroides distasonis]
MAIKFQYNKTSLQQLEKQLKMRERSLPTIKSKESALRIEVKRTKDEVNKLELQLEREIQSYENMVALWNEFNPELISVKDVTLSTKKIAGVIVPLLDEIKFEIGHYSLFNAPAWYTDGIELLKKLARTGIEAEFSGMKLELLEHARKKTTQKVNLFEKVQIPGYKDAIRKVKRFMEDEESLSKSSQKIMRANQEKRKAKRRKRGGRGMIVKMSKYAFMVYHKEYDTFLSTLRDLGVVHIKETNSVMDNERLQELLAERKQINTLMRYFKNLHAAEKDVKFAPARELTKEEGLKLVRKIEELQDKKAQLIASKQSIEKDLAYMEIWGEFSYQNINRLKRAGYDVTFFTCPTAKYEPEWGVLYNAILINNFQSVTYFITITKEGTLIDIDAERPKMPVQGLAKLRARLDQRTKDIQNVEDELKHRAVEDYKTLEEFDKNLQDEFNLSNALVQTDRQAGDKLMLLEGWVPTENAPALEHELDKQGYFFQQLEIEDGDKVPIKLRNNKFSKLYEPITKMFSLPNYGELDPTPLFAPFFMLFFGLCFGDGGYGLLVMIACTILKKKVNPDFKPYLTLFQYLGFAALLVGTCTGSFFGVALADIPALSKIKNYFVNSDNLMTFSIVIGLVQIIFGKCVAAYKIKIQKGTKHSIAPFAWVFVIISLALALGLPMLNVHLPNAVVMVCYGIAILGLVVAYLYNTPGKNVFLNFGTGLWNTYNMASGLLGDTLSYIRLFAIGLTGSILGGVFNTLAVTMTDGMNIVARAICMLLILLVGHSINIALCTISSLVHPLRLIFVEYYKNAEFEGGGKAYEPFRKA